MTNPFTRIRERWVDLKHQRYLKQMGWTQEAYDRRNDPDCNMRADRIKDYYHGYQHTHVYETARGEPWSRYPTWLEALEEMRQWCRENCRDKWRDDILRVYQQHSISWDHTTEQEWVINDIGGGDALFVAFKDDRDFMLFLLKWG